MPTEILLDRDFSTEFNFSVSRSSGPGGQNVNKVNSKVELRFNVDSSVILNEEEKALIKEKLKSKITENGEIVLVSQNERSQFRNKEHVIGKFYLLINKALQPKKARKPTKLSKAAKEKRLELKKIRSVKKQFRKIPEL